MGYESTLIIGRESTIPSFNSETKKPDDTYSWFHQYAEIDLCKIGGLDIQYDKFPKVFIFGTDGNTEIKEDKYGDPLVALPAGLVLIQLKCKDQEYADHRRIKWAISLIEHMIELSGEDEISIVHFGH